MLIRSVNSILQQLSGTRRWLLPAFISFVMWSPHLTAATDLVIDGQRLDVAVPFIDETHMRFGPDGNKSDGVDIPGIGTINEALQQHALRLVVDLMPFGTVEGGYKMHVARPDLMSTTMQYSGYNKYMAHPMHKRTSVTADPMTGKMYTLADLFVDETYVERLSEKIAHMIKNRDVPVLTPFDRIAPEQDFYVGRCSLVIYFQLYELAPYAWGFPEFTIPFSFIKDIVSTDGAKICPVHSKKRVE